MPFIAGLIIGAVFMCAIMMRCFTDVHARIDALESRVVDDFDNVEVQVTGAAGHVAEVMPHQAPVA